jgi:hypothetical protein
MYSTKQLINLQVRCIQHWTVALHQFRTLQVQFQFLPTPGHRTFLHHLLVQGALLLAHPTAATFQVLPLAATTQRQLLTHRHLATHPNLGTGLPTEASSNQGESLFSASLSLCYSWLWNLLYL